MDLNEFENCKIYIDGEYGDFWIVEKMMYFILRSFEFWAKLNSAPNLENSRKFKICQISA